ncbi:Sec-independent protein translocase protein TatB [Phytoactinopolyspora mesophila]|uniref:Sec-independent protein translocase protein TatB n=1 Tax=Phytoactinopolyspora mesophila TaxID=2650750 RepID=A0A7K3M9Q3_9ACTN|nr:twin-arginine translocase subunit TatB [Phytoactinopolyspora mesophila]
MSDIGIGEIAVILVVALIVFGPDRLPTMIKQASAFINDLRKMVTSARRDLTESVSDLGIDENDLKTLTDLRNPKSYLRQKVLEGVDPSELGLDEFEDLGERLELPNKKKQPRATNGAAKRKPATNGASNRAGSTRASTPGAGTSHSGAARTTASRGPQGSVAGSSSEPADAAASTAEGAATAKTTPTGARFDPDTT